MSTSATYRRRKRRRQNALEAFGPDAISAHKIRSGRTGGMHTKNLRSRKPSKKLMRKLFKELGLTEGKHRMGP